MLKTVNNNKSFGMCSRVFWYITNASQEPAGSLFYPDDRDTSYGNYQTTRRHIPHTVLFPHRRSTQSSCLHWLYQRTRHLPATDHTIMNNNWTLPTPVDKYQYYAEVTTWSMNATEYKHDEDGLWRDWRVS
jgi:hypothetical protein